MDNHQNTGNWMDRWKHLLPYNQTPRALDLGCGDGDDTRYLTGLGIEVVSVDISETALTSSKRKQPENSFLQVDVRQGLPFIPGRFRLIVANLSLHFFDAAKTREVVADVRRCLADDGWLFARFNSTRDIQPRTVREIEIEPNFFQTRSLRKRFFNREMVVELFAGGWEIQNLEEIVTKRHGKPKIVWELIVHKQ